jgi:hypothetical protein
LGESGELRRAVYGGCRIPPRRICDVGVAALAEPRSFKSDREI